MYACEWVRSQVGKGCRAPDGGCRCCEDGFLRLSQSKCFHPAHPGRPDTLALRPVIIRAIAVALSDNKFCPELMQHRGQHRSLLQHRFRTGRGRRQGRRRRWMGRGLAGEARYLRWSVRVIAAALAHFRWGSPRVIRIGRPTPWPQLCLFGATKMRRGSSGRMRGRRGQRRRRSHRRRRRSRCGLRKLLIAPSVLFGVDVHGSVGLGGLFEPCL